MIHLSREKEKLTDMPTGQSVEATPKLRVPLPQIYLGVCPLTQPNQDQREVIGNRLVNCYFLMLSVPPRLLLHICLVSQPSLQKLLPPLMQSLPWGFCQHLGGGSLELLDYKLTY